MPAGAGQRAKDLAIAFVETHGDRAAGTASADAAQRDVLAALVARGWVGRTVGAYPGSVYGCQSGASSRVFLAMAHTDTVPGTVGGNDNGAAVGVLLAVAELLRGVPTPRTVCLAFPDAEEIGLRGSRSLMEYAERGGLGGSIDQAMALDLVGVGELTHVGLGPTWGWRQLTVLLSTSPGAAPWVHRAIAVRRPDLDRSDHAWFTWRGIPSSQLYARGVGGVDWAYHSPADTPDRLEPETMQRAVEAVVGAARGPVLPEEAPDRSALVLPWTAIVLPGWVTWVGLMLGPLGWLGGVGRPSSGPAESIRAASLWWLHGVAAAAALALSVLVALAGRRLDLALAGPAVLAGWSAWSAVALVGSSGASDDLRRGLGGLAALVPAVALIALGSPLLALPFALAALGVGLTRWTRVGALLAAWPALFLFRPDAIRELAFHDLFGAKPLAWAMLAGILLLPLLGALPEPSAAARRRLGALLALATLIAWLGAWAMPEQVPPFVDHDAHSR